MSRFARIAFWQNSQAIPAQNGAGIPFAETTEQTETGVTEGQEHPAIPETYRSNRHRKLTDMFGEQY